MMKMDWPILLVDKCTARPSIEDSWKMEQRLLVFAVWLARSYEPGTVNKYVYDVKAAHTEWLGVPLRALGVAFHRLPVLLKVLEKKKSTKKRVKVAWNMEQFAAVVTGIKARGRLGDFGEGHHGYQRAVVWVIMLLAFEQLFRLSELVKTRVASVSELTPLMRSDGYFVDGQGQRIAQDSNGRWALKPEQKVAKFIMREPPSKTNAVGQEDGIECPFPAGWEMGVGFTAAGPAMWRLQQRYPVPQRYADMVPMFGLVEWKAGVVVERFSETQYKRVFNGLCRGCKMQYIRYGLHCMRVGGTNRLIDLGASCPQVCAAGRWAGDCWKLYQRRQRKSQLELTKRMAVG